MKLYLSESLFSLIEAVALARGGAAHDDSRDVDYSSLLTYDVSFVSDINLPNVMFVSQQSGTSFHGRD